MTTALTNTQIQTTYGDALQLGNSGTGILTTLLNIRDGLGNATALWLSTDEVHATGAKGFTVPNLAGYPANPGGYRAYQADGVTAITLIALSSSNNGDLDPGQTMGLLGCGTNFLLRHGKSYFIESHDITQDLLVVSVSDTAANDLHIGNATSAGSSQLGDTYLDLQTGKNLHCVINTTEVFKIGSAGDISLGLTAPGTGATAGFPCVPLMAGAPVGANTPPTGFASMVVDSSNNKVWFRYGGGWKFAALT